ncbi:SH3 domain-containing protein [Oceanirhabdus seepicola]|uniref:SH3 domain-containing protein n=1 Tax=Oceanirhabdus seepicola TaxID=2828781 RepID=A0A9J6P296_9CLOT|nr:SH3 domain-containing protein [Oceanirhabdus seepicola]MCM1990021.1 SH3 domain-containing protein [Oceanirhabdus seepicola]
MRVFYRNISKIGIILLCIILFYGEGVQAIHSEFIMKHGYYDSDKVWKVVFNAPISEESLDYIGVFKDKEGKEAVTGIKVKYGDKNKNTIFIYPPNTGYMRGAYYLIINSEVKTSKEGLSTLDKEVVAKFNVETLELKGVNIESNIFKHYEVEEEMLKNDFWIDNIKDKNVHENIEAINTANVKNVDTMLDIYSLRESINKDEIMKMINRYKIPSRIMYNKDEIELKDWFYDEIIKNLNKDKIKDETKLRYGVVTTRSDIRSFPTDVEFHKVKGDRFDRIQETAFEAGEGVTVLHESLDENWLFVQGQNYAGWMKRENVAFDSREEVRKFVEAEEFIVITQDRVSVEYNGKKYYYSMGVKLPIRYKDMEMERTYASIPIRDENGNLKVVQAKVKNIDYSEGYLQATRENIIKQAFKLQGTDYSWGDKSVGRDCSSTMMGIYRTMGIYLPRNTDEQEDSYGSSTNLNGLDTDRRYEKVKELQPGDLIFMNGHEVMYIGRWKERDYIIHNFTGATLKDDKGTRYGDVFRMAVTPLDMLSGSGKSYINLYSSYLKILE